MSNTDSAPESVPAASSFSQFLQMLEDGDLHSELTAALGKLNQAMTDHHAAFGGKPKGKLTLSINFVLDKGIFEISGDITTKLPTPPRGRTIAWATGDHRFTGHNPSQYTLFGVRDVTDGAGKKINTV